MHATLSVIWFAHAHQVCMLNSMECLCTTIGDLLAIDEFQIKSQRKYQIKEVNKKTMQENREMKQRCNLSIEEKKNVEFMRELGIVNGLK